MDIAFKIVNSVRGRSLQRRLFNLTLDEGAAEIILHTDVRWLSRHKFLQGFHDLLNEINFLKEREDDQAELEDEEWLCDLAFLADFTGELSDMNLELQGKNKCISKMMSTVSSHKSKFELMMTDLANNTFDHFPNMQDHLGQYPNFVFQNEKYVAEICSVIQEFENRFCDFQKIGTVVEYLSYPFKVDVDIKETAAALSKNYSLNKPSLENEILTLKNDIFLKTHAEQESFWKLVPRDKFLNLRRCSEAVHSCFGSTYLCESAFSHLKMTKSTQCSNMTDEHLQDSLRLALTQHSPNFKKLVDEMQAQTSH
ncbi:general transcription factor II-I repeat domain-containing protein 2B-like [Tiliqua scincoides]|uniref:general transcription factor II-I repeat domain-containing protein 2B-like n=1 Tax=Tiliqua scincoides TaxID=71010 RepID=UPI00346343F0